jgi:hypothetical protein
MGINKTFEELFKDTTIKFTIILGSGYHREALGNNSILSNWELLLKSIDPKIRTTKFYPLDYEQIIINESLKSLDLDSEGKNSSGIEERVSKILCHDLKCAQKKSVDFYKEKYPIQIFNPEKISDVISLNFDTLAEELCITSLYGKKVPVEEKKSRFDSPKNEGFEISYWEVKSSESKSIRFWYPHGSTHESDLLKLGTREYSKCLSQIERLRKHSKRKEKESSDITDTSWYHQLIVNPVIILGAELSNAEWDIWFAFVNRERNFSRNQQHKFPIFQMVEKKKTLGQKRGWVDPLFTEMDFTDQWKELEKLFSK